MAKSIFALAVISVMLAVAVEAHPGRKMLQIRQSVDKGGPTASEAETEARINAAVANAAKPKPTQAPKDAVVVAAGRTNPSAAGTTTATLAAAGPKTNRGAAGGASGGKITAAESTTEAKIGEAASGTKPTKPAAPAAPKPTTTIATTTKTDHGGALMAGRATAAQGATEASISAAAGGAKPAKP